MSLSEDVLASLGLSQPVEFSPLGTLQHQESAAPSFHFQLGRTPLLLEAHAPGVFRLRFGKAPSKQRFPTLIREEAVGEGALEQNDKTWVLTQGEDRLQIESDPLKIRLLKGDKELLAIQPEGDLPGLGLVADSERWIVHIRYPSQGAVYGLDEREGTLHRQEALSGNHPLERNSAVEGPRGLPFLWSPDGWGLFTNTLNDVVHSVGHLDNGITIRVDDPLLDLFVFCADPEAIFNQFTALTGRPIAPPLWALGTWVRFLSASESHEAVLLAQAWRKAGLPLDVVCFDGTPPWQPGSKLLLEWVGTQAPAPGSLGIGSGITPGAPLPERVVRLLGEDDPRVPLAALRAQNIHVGYSETTQVPITGPAHDELEDRLWLLGEGGDQIDLTHTDAFNTWRDRHKALLDEGVDFIWTRSASLPKDAEGRHGDTGTRLAQLQVGLQSRSLMEAALAAHGPLEALVVSDASTLFSARTNLLAELDQPVLAGLSPEQAEALLESQLRSEVSCGHAGLVSCAQPNVLPASDPLFLRALVRAVFSPHFHLTAPVARSLLDQSEERLAVAKAWLTFRQRLLPYLVGCFEDSARNGLPPLRGMAMAFPQDRQSHEFEHQYLLGPALLVAPLLGESNTQTVWLPQGEAWWDLNTGWRYEGGQAIDVTCSALQYPVFGREGHILSLGPVIQHYGEFNSARVLDEVWLFGMPLHNPCVMRNKIRVMQMQGSSYVKGLEGLRILPSEGLEVKRRGAEVRISRAR